MRAEHLYIHVPFCARRCVYCDFSIAVRPVVPVEEYVSAIEREWALRDSATPLNLATVYLGGGTPSKLGGAGVARLLEVVTKYASLSEGAEVTLEANPEDVTPDVIRAWKAAGVNRISLGIQSFADDVLRWMHRTHDAAMAVNAIHAIRDGGIANLSIDLIFAAPAGVSRSWQRDVEQAIAMDVPHVSAYGLTVEPHTPLGHWVARREVREAPEDRFGVEYAMAHAQLTAAGFDHYEVSNYGKPGLHSRHNWAYWRRKPYIGLGPSAHEFDGTSRRWNCAPYTEWMERLRRGEAPVSGSEELTAEQEAAESIYLNLRTSTGVQLLRGEAARLSRWIDAGWAACDSEGVLRLTAQGWLRLDTLASDLTLLRSR